MISKKITQISYSIVLALIVGVAEAKTTRPADEQQLARSIYKQFIEVQSGFTTGSTTPLVKVAVKYLKKPVFLTRTFSLVEPVHKKPIWLYVIVVLGRRNPCYYLRIRTLLKPKLLIGA